MTEIPFDSNLILLKIVLEIQKKKKKKEVHKIYTNCVITSCNEGLSHVSFPQITALFSQESRGSLLEICGSIDVSYHSISHQSLLHPNIMNFWLQGALYV